MDGKHASQECAVPELEGFADDERQVESLVKNILQTDLCLGNELVNLTKSILEGAG
jgi:hypothetical protein